MSWKERLGPRTLGARPKANLRGSDPFILWQDERLQDALTELRGKFKALVTMMGLKSQHFLRENSVSMDTF